MKSPSTQLSLPIEGMSCASCAGRIQRALQNEAGVSNAVVNFATEQAQVSFDPDTVSASRLTAVIDEAGYHVRTRAVDLSLQGMRCASCAGRIERALQGVAGVVTAEVNLASETAHVLVVPGRVHHSELINAVRAAGYDATSPEEKVDTREEEDARRVRRELFSVLVSGALTFPLVLPMLLGPWGVYFHLPGLVQMSLALLVQSLFGARFYVGAWKALRARTANMDTLVALGTSAALLLSLWHLQDPSLPLYFESSAVIITLVCLGKLLESRAKRGTTQAVRALMALRPATARVEEDGSEKEVPVERVMRGQRVIVRPGESLPVDGEIVQGESEIDESLITGESVPQARGPGDHVIAGSINGSGLLHLRATDVLEDSLLARIQRYVESAQGSKAPIQRQVDRVAAVFVPLVLGIAVLSVAGWLLLGFSFEQAMLAGVSVLVIACPCALGLATPAALSVATGVAARSGILIKNAEALERARSIDTVVFDKTGTLTHGKPLVESVLADDPNALLALAAALQQGSEHPLAEAVRVAADERSLQRPQATDFRAFAGRGTSALINKQLHFIGSPRFRDEHGFDAGRFRDAACSEENRGRTTIWVFSETELLGALTLFDLPRAHSRAAIDTLKQRGIFTVLLSGDNAAAARSVGEMLGVDRIIAEVLPEQKSEQITALQKEGRRVAMVGDGVNDAPALATADVGFAMGTGSDVAIHSAGITLVRPEPTLVGSALELSRRTTRKIHQNLFWAFAYNAVGIPLAAFGLLTPMIAGAAMAFSSVSVLANALLLRRWSAEQ